MCLNQCELCPRRCRVDREGGELGFCRAGSEPVIFSHSPHHGEEPSISGVRGSGTVFFSNCTLKCIYCQNYPWSTGGDGEKYDLDRLVAVFKALHLRGCHNWNVVSPTPWLPFIEKAIMLLRKDGMSLPLVYNTSGFERFEVLRDIADLVDIYLVDLRYSRGESALEGSGREDYVEISRKAFREMWDQKGPLKLDDEGIARSGVICRLLILPSRAQEVVDNLQWLAETVGTDVTVSVMSQYIPAHRARAMETWSRQISREEYELVTAAVKDLGFDKGWVQDYGGATDESLVGFRMKKNGL